MKEESIKSEIIHLVNKSNDPILLEFVKTMLETGTLDAEGDSIEKQVKSRVLIKN